MNINAPWLMSTKCVCLCLFVCLLVYKQESKAEHCLFAPFKGPLVLFDELLVTEEIASYQGVRMLALAKDQTDTFYVDTQGG